MSSIILWLLLLVGVGVGYYAWSRNLSARDVPTALSNEARVLADRYRAGRPIAVQQVPVDNFPK